MKKPKLDLDSIKTFFLEHGEKLALGVVGVVFLMFVWGAIKRETLDADKQPDRLEAKANEVRTHVESSQFDAKREGLAVVDYLARAKRDPIDPGVFSLPTPINPIVIEQKASRDDPKLLAIEELRAVGAYGTFALTNPAAAGGAPGAPPPRGNAAGERRPARAVGRGNAGYQCKPESDLKSRGFVVITGLIPVHKQAQAYAEVFQYALGGDSNRDKPNYLAYVLERAEINPAAPDNLDWKEVNPPERFDAKFEATMPDVVHQEYIDTKLTEQLGPLLYEAWGASVVHRPQIPLKDEAAAPGAPRVQEAPPSGPVAAQDNPAFRSAARPEANVPGSAAARAAQTAAAANASPTVLEYRLLRAFDFTVDPAKRYRYRVKAVLANPNHGVAVKYLKNPAAKQAEYVYTAPSNATPVVAIPDGYGVLAATPTEKIRSSDPDAQMVVTAINPDKGTEAAAKFTAARGSVANLSGVKTNVFDPRDNMIETVESANLHAGIVILDIRGGQVASKKSTSDVLGPVEVLVVDSKGNLTVRSDLDDQAKVESRLPPEDEPPSRAKGDAKGKGDPVDKEPGGSKGRRSREGKGNVELRETPAGVKLPPKRRDADDRR
jgi:hypothetical protein